MAKKWRKRYDARLAEVERKLGGLDTVLGTAMATLSELHTKVIALDPVALEALRAQALNAIRGIGRKQQALEASQEAAATPPATLPLPTLAEARRRAPGSFAR